MARRIALLEGDLERAEERATKSERFGTFIIMTIVNEKLNHFSHFIVNSKGIELDNELRKVGNNLKSLEANEEKVSNNDDNSMADASANRTPAQPFSSYFI